MNGLWMNPQKDNYVCMRPAKTSSSIGISPAAITLFKAAMFYLIIHLRSHNKIAKIRKSNNLLIALLSYGLRPISGFQ